MGVRRSTVPQPRLRLGLRANATAVSPEMQRPSSTHRPPGNPMRRVARATRTANVAPTAVRRTARESINGVRAAIAVTASSGAIGTGARTMGARTMGAVLPIPTRRARTAAAQTVPTVRRPVSGPIERTARTDPTAGRRPSGPTAPTVPTGRIVPTAATTAVTARGGVGGAIAIATGADGIGSATRASRRSTRTACSCRCPVWSTSSTRTRSYGPRGTWPAPMTCTSPCRRCASTDCAAVT